MFIKRLKRLGGKKRLPREGAVFAINRKLGEYLLRKNLLMGLNYLHHILLSNQNVGYLRWSKGLVFIFIF